MKLSDLRLGPGIERIPLGSEIERFVSSDQHSKSVGNPVLVRDDRGGVDNAPRTSARRVVSPYTDRRLTIEQVENGDVLLTRPDGARVRIYPHALECTLGTSTKESEQ